MQIVEKSIETLKVYGNNARTHDDKQIKQIVDSIKTFGFNNPILVDAEGVIIAGHGRLAAAKALGLTNVPTVTLDHLTDAERKAYIIADNKIASNAGWDYSLLKLEFEQIIANGVEVELTGFGKDEIDAILNTVSLDSIDEDEEVQASDVPAVSVLGDVWLLDKHIVYCADNTTVDFKASEDAMVFSDPPYELDVASIYDACRRTKCNHIVLIATFRQLAEFYSTDYDFCFDFVLNAHIPKSFCNRKQPYYLHQNGAYFRTSGVETIFNNDLSKGVRSDDTSDTGYWPTIIDAPRSLTDGHGHAKSVQGIVDAMCAFGAKEVVDMYAGGGSTLLACEKLRRRCIAVELEPKNVDLIIARWQKLTGKQAVHAETGELYDSRRN